MGLSFESGEGGGATFAPGYVQELDVPDKFHPALL
jgi:hypothetical protein